MSTAAILTLTLLVSAPTGGQQLNASLGKIQQLTAQKKAPVVVLDLDSTLFNNAPRTKQILLEIAASEPTLRRFYPKLYTLPDTLPYLVGDVLKQAGITRAAEKNKFEKAWKERFFEDRYVVHDTALRGAVQYVYSAAQKGATIVYLTGRNAPGMGAGTVESLRRNGFPVLTPNAILIMKPNFSMSDEKFKRDALAAVQRLGHVVATFENEPRNANMFAQRWPGGMHFILNTNSNPRKKTPLSRSVIRINDFTLESSVNKAKAAPTMMRKRR